MRGGALVAVVVGGLSLALAGCEGVAHPACSTAEDVAAKLTRLTDDLRAAEAKGKIDALAAGDIAARIMEAGAEHGRGSNLRAYCAALDEIRADTKL